MKGGKLNLFLKGEIAVQQRKNVCFRKMWQFHDVILSRNLKRAYTVKPRPEAAHMDMILFEVFLKSIDLIPQQQIYNSTIYIIDNVIVLSDLVESHGYSSKTVKKGSCPYAPLDEVLRYTAFCLWKT